jgi:hypothetical protein
MIKPNAIFQREYSVHGLPVSTAIGGMFSAMLFLFLMISKTADLATSTAIVFPFAAATGFFSGKRYKDFLINLMVHPHCLYSQVDKRSNGTEKNRQAKNQANSRFN